MMRELIRDIRALKYEQLFGDTDYFIEYSEWLSKLKIDKSLSLKIMDIGCDNFVSLYQYLRFKNYNISEYYGYDLNFSIIKKQDTIQKKDTQLSYIEFMDNLAIINFLKIDCEGCEDNWIEFLDQTNFPDMYYSIAIHTFSLNYDYNKQILKQNNFKLAYITPDKKEYLYVRRMKR